MGDMAENLHYEDKQEYDELTGDESLFPGKDNTADIFVLGLAIGYKQGTKKPLAQKLPNIRLKTRGPKFWWMIRPLPITKSKSIDPLLDESKIYPEAEEYSNAGIKAIHKIIFLPGSKKMDRRIELMRLIDKLAKA